MLVIGRNNESINDKLVKINKENVLSKKLRGPKGNTVMHSISWEMNYVQS